MTVDFIAEAEAMRDELVSRRRDFHQHPELAFEEVRTAGIVADELRKLGLEVQTGIGKTGVIGVLDGADDGPTVLVRADMDALPIDEANEVEYASTVAGKMHACGHDGHTAIALGVAKLFASQREHIAGRIKFVFQPAEEVGGGAKAMIADGALHNPRPDVSLGLHLWNDLPVGMVSVADGPTMAATSDFTIELTGQGGHGAQPNKTVDPVICAAHITTALQTIVSRNADPLDAAVVSVTQIHTGTAMNIIPQTATMTGTFRTYRQQTRDLVQERIRELATHTAAAFGCEVSVQIDHHTEPVVNDPDVVTRVRRAFHKVGKSEADFAYERTMGAEDVGEFMTDIPGMYFFLGSANPERNLNFAHHHPRFDFDEDVLPQGVALLSAAVAEYVLNEEDAS
jgi:amidohydrolase